MKQILVLLMLAPALIFAQGKQKPKTKITEPIHNPALGYIIDGTVTGYPDGTQVNLLNGSTGMSEASAVILKNKFTIKGSVPSPEFKILLFNRKAPFITLFLDNSAVKVKGSSQKIELASVTGSKSHSDFDAFNKLLAPIKFVFDDCGNYDSATFAKAKNMMAEFAIQRPNSYITPLVLMRFNQLLEEPSQAEVLFNALLPGVKASAMGQEAAYQIAQAKNNPIGSVLPDFTETDTSGRKVPLSSLRGKYVLIDFWASWCGPCRQENPNVVQAYNKFKNKNFTVLGVSLDKAKPAWIDAINIDNLTWNHVSDLQGWENLAAQQYQIRTIPQNILLDPQGKVVAKNLRCAKLERKLSRLLN